MSKSTARQRAESQLRFLLLQRSEQLETFNSSNARLVIRAFSEWADADEVVSLVMQPLERRRTVSPKTWTEQALRDGRCPPLPDDPAQAMALRYGLLKLVRMDKVDLRYFASNLFPGNFLDEKLMHWKRLIVHPFGEDCRTVARALLDRLDGEWVDVTALTEEYLDGPFKTEGFGPRGWTDEDDARVEAELKKKKKVLTSDAASPAAAAAPAAPAPTSPVEVAAPAESSADSTIVTRRRAAEPSDAGLSVALEALAHALEGAGANGDALVDLAALQLEARRRVRAVDRMRARIEALGVAVDHAPVAQACARVLDAL